MYIIIKFYCDSTALSTIQCVFAFCMQRNGQNDGNDNAFTVTDYKMNGFELRTCLLNRLPFVSSRLLVFFSVFFFFSLSSFWDNLQMSHNFNRVLFCIWILSVSEAKKIIIMWNPIENGFVVCILHKRTEQIKFLIQCDCVDCGVWRSVDNLLFLLYFHPFRPEFGIEMDFSMSNIHNSHAI